MRVAFCDLDGVLVLPTGHCQADPECVKQLNRVTQKTGAMLVLTSTWRRQGFPAMRRQLREWGVAGVLYDLTKDLSETRNGLVVGVERGVEVKAWLDEHAVSGYVILDDDKDFTGLEQHLVQTNSYVGLTKADADKAIEMLRQNLTKEKASAQ